MAFEPQTDWEKKVEGNILAFQEIIRRMAFVLKNQHPESYTNIVESLKGLIEKVDKMDAGGDPLLDGFRQTCRSFYEHGTESKSPFTVIDGGKKD